MVLLAAMVLLFTGSAISTSWARIAALQTVEPYAFAVHEQLMATFAATGEFAQTIHRGYDDNWMWSGHRAITFLFNAFLYRIRPGPWWLSSLQIGAVAMGAIPAAWLGRRALRSRWGLLLGGGVYLGAPAVMALSLQDYQDLVFALPCLMITLVAVRSRSIIGVLLGAAIGCLPREECVPLVVACGVVSWPWAGGLRRWLRNLALVSLVAGLYALVMVKFFPVSMGSHDMPLWEDLQSLLGGGSRIRLHGWPYLKSFYALVWAPLGGLALLSPWTALPGLALLGLHMTIPFNHGVDRHWGDHVHHMAVILPFIIAATVLGGARLLRWSLRWRARGVRPLMALVGVGLVSYAVWWDMGWVRYFDIILSPVPLAPAWWHPAWRLVEALPEDAVPIVPRNVSLAVSSRVEAYTFGESLLDKGGDLGLAVGTHLIVHQQQQEVLDWVMEMEGARVVATAEPFLLITWKPGAPDLVFRSWGERRPRRIPDWPWRGPAAGTVRGLAPPNPHPVSGVPLRAGKIGG